MQSSFSTPVSEVIEFPRDRAVRSARLAHNQKVASSNLAPATNLASYVTAGLRYDIPAIKAEAKIRYGAKLGFINRYSGTARRYWQWRQARRVLADVWKEARAQRHAIVWPRIPRELPFTNEELARRSELLARMTSAGITMQGNADYRAASGEYGQIGARAQRRAYDAILATAWRVS